MPSTTKSILVLCWLAFGVPALFAGMALEVGKGGGSLAFPHSNGRQIARSSSGLWFLAYDGQVDGAAAILLAGSRGAAPEVTGDFESPVVLVGKSSRALIKAEGEPHLASIAISPASSAEFSVMPEYCFAAATAFSAAFSSADADPIAK